MSPRGPRIAEGIVRDCQMERVSETLKQSWTTKHRGRVVWVVCPRTWPLFGCVARSFPLYIVSERFRSEHALRIVV